MPEALATELALLRTLAAHLERRPLPFERLTQALLHRPVLPSYVGRDARARRRARGQGAASRAKTSPARSCDGMD